MRGRKGITLSAAAFIVLVLIEAAAAADRLSLNEAVNLYPAPKQNDSYSLYYDITLKSPGLIRIGLEVDAVLPETQGQGSFLSISLRQRDEEVEVRLVPLGREGGTFSYGVDAYELDRTKGEYRIVISNWSLRNTVSARLVALYPGSEEAETPSKVIMIPGSSI